jgi:predicted phage terminase large subunit-like protein
MVKGESGFLALCPKVDRLKNGKYVARPEWSPTKRTLSWFESDKNGVKKQKADGTFVLVATIECYSAEEPERLRGPQFEFAWGDELAAWNKDQETWDMLQFCLRLGKHPRVCVTTTPKSTVLVRKLLKDPKTYVTTGSTFDNSSNLADTYLQAVRDQYEGTRLGRQELYAEVLNENEGALWTADLIDACQITSSELPPLIRKVVAVDPAVSSNVESDNTGIVVAGICEQGKAYILGDYTFKGSPETWANKVVSLYHEFECSRIVYESNQGKDLIPSLFKTIDENLPLKGVHASTAKIARAEPVSALYEQGKVYHVRDCEAPLTELEQQYTTFEPLGKHKSPDRYDAAVWALTDLMLKGFAKPQLKLVYSNSKGLR